MSQRFILLSNSYNYSKLRVKYYHFKNLLPSNSTEDIIRQIEASTFEKKEEKAA